MPKPYSQGRSNGYSVWPLKGPLDRLAGLPVLMLDCSFRCSSSHFFSEHAKGNLSSGDANSGSVSSENKKSFLLQVLSSHQTQKMFTYNANNGNGTVETDHYKQLIESRLTCLCNSMQYSVAQQL